MLRLSLICLFLCITQIRSYVITHKSDDCNGKTGFFKDDTNPHKFHECVNGKIENFTCPETLVFIEAKNLCDFESSVVTKTSVDGTTGKVTNPSTEATTKKVTNPSTARPTVKVTKPPVEVTTRNSKIDCNEKSGLFKDNANPHTFHECVNGKVGDFTCPENLVFNEAKKQCDFESSVVINPTVDVTTRKVTNLSTVGTTREVTNPPTAGPTVKFTTGNSKSDCKGKSGLFKDSTNPHEFHECANGILEDFICPDNLVFNEAKRQCDFDSSVATNPSTVSTTRKVTNPPTVGSTIKVTKTPEVATTVKSKNDCNGKSGFFKDSTNPHKFHECFNGKIEDFTCPESLVFNEAKNACDFN